MTRAACQVIVAVLALLGTGAVYAQESSDITSDITIEAEFGFRGYALERSWMPALVQIRASATAFAGPVEAIVTVEVSRRTGSREDAYVLRSTERLVPGSTTELQYTLPMYDGFLPIRISVDIDEQRHERSFNVERALRDSQIIVALSRAPVFDQLQRTSTGTGISTVLSYPFPERLPHHILGYDAVALVVFHDLPFDRLVAEQRQALLGYVATGGTLVLGEGFHSEDSVREIRSQLSDRASVERVRVLRPSEVVELVESGYLDNAQRLRTEAWPDDVAGAEDVASRAMEQNLLDPPPAMLAIAVLLVAVLGTGLLLYLPMTTQTRTFLLSAWLVLTLALTLVVSRGVVFPQLAAGLGAERIYATAGSRIGLVHSDVVLARIASVPTSIAFDRNQVMRTRSRGLTMTERENGSQVFQDQGEGSWSLVHAEAVSIEAMPVFVALSEGGVALRNTRNLSARVWYKGAFATEPEYLGSLDAMAVDSFSFATEAQEQAGAATGAGAGAAPMSGLARAALGDLAPGQEYLLLVYGQMLRPPLMPPQLQDVEYVSVVVLEVK